MLKNKEKILLCPCDSGKPFQDCCQPYLEQGRNAATAEALMRSRYTAFVSHDKPYIHYTWHPNNRPKIITLGENTKWLGLKIISTTEGGENDLHGEVEFIARNQNNGKINHLREKSQFVRFENRWVYTQGKITDTIANKIINK